MGLPLTKGGFISAIRQRAEAYKGGGDIKMKDFIYAALPWIIMGLTIAVLAVKFSKANSKKDNEIVDKSNMDDKKEAHNNK